MSHYNFREELKVAYCINPDVQYCNECAICKNTDKLVHEFAQTLNFKLREKFMKNMDDKERTNWIVPEEMEEIINNLIGEKK